ncbi:hypothetical protein QVD99_005059 [Batrachochytrium dendrobatidis]|nr:hypothetical protein QVD99_005059 [Batrachochytrium dendrobatidis]
MADCKDISTSPPFVESGALTTVEPTNTIHSTTASTSSNIAAEVADTLNPRKRPLSPALDLISSVENVNPLMTTIPSQPHAPKAAPDARHSDSPQQQQNDVSHIASTDKPSVSPSDSNAAHDVPDAKRPRLNYQQSDTPQIGENTTGVTPQISATNAHTDPKITEQKSLNAPSTADQPETPNQPDKPDHPEQSDKPTNTTSIIDNSKLSSAENQLVDSQTGSEDVKKKLTYVDVTLDKMQFLQGQRAVVNQLIEEAKKNKMPGEMIVVNDSRLTTVPKGFESVFLGHVVYTGARSRNPHSNRAADLQLFLLPQFTYKHHYATIQVRIPSEFLTYRGNIAVRKSALWGTDIYTDDSDVVAMIIHSGHYCPVDAPDPKPETALQTAASKASRVGTNGTAAKTSTVSTLKQSHGVNSPISVHVDPLIATPDVTQSSTNALFPDHDLHVTLRVLPKLVKYSGCTRYDLDSRGWGASHDGESVMVERVERVERGSVGRKGRKMFSKKWGELAKAVTKEEEAVFFDGGTIERHMDTEFDEDFGDLTVVFSEHNGKACIKYTPKMMMEWPSHMLNMLSEIKPQLRRKSIATTAVSAVGSGLATGASGIVKFSRSELKDMEAWPYWRVKLCKFTCVLETIDGLRHELKQEGLSSQTYRLEQLTNVYGASACRRGSYDSEITTKPDQTQPVHLHSKSAPNSTTVSTLPSISALPGGEDAVKGIVVAEKIAPNALAWTEAGLCIHAQNTKPLMVFPVHKVYWRKPA